MITGTPGSGKKRLIIKSEIESLNDKFDLEKIIRQEIIKMYLAKRSLEIAKEIVDKEKKND